MDTTRTDVRFSNLTQLEHGYSISMSSWSVKSQWIDYDTGKVTKYYRPYTVDLPGKIMIETVRYNGKKYANKYLIRQGGLSDIMLKLRTQLYRLNKAKIGTKKRHIIDNVTDIQLKLSNHCFDEDSPSKGYLLRGETGKIPVELTHVYYSPDKDSITVSVRIPDWDSLDVYVIDQGESFFDAYTKKRKRLRFTPSVDTVGELLTDLEHETDEEHWG